VWAPELVWVLWRRENFFSHQDLNHNTFIIQSVANHYTDFAVPAHTPEVRCVSSILTVESEEAWSLGET